MKRKSIITLLVFCMGLGMTTTSCEDMLSPDSNRHSYEVAEDTLYSYWGILKSLQHVAEKYVILGECRGDMVQGTGYVSDTINAICNFGMGNFAEKLKDGTSVYTSAADYYHIINSCNAYIAHCDTVKTTGTNQKYMMGEYAQVEAIRAWTYMQLVQVYGEVPFYLDPLLTTEAIDEFINDPGHETVNADNLADKLGARLVKMEPYELYGSEGYEQYVYPQYESYGFTSNVCHSSLCMFPVSLVLADMYLMKGDAESCKQAAQHYYTYLNTENGGPIYGNNYYSEVGFVAGEDKATRSRTGNPFIENAKARNTTEAITCIPSNKNKNWGVVLRDINRLFGYTANISVGTSGSGATASISLSRNFERELIASKGYENLCAAQQYEIYIGTTTEITNGDLIKPTVVPDAGDARYVWVPEYQKKEGEETIFGHFVDKQNAGSTSLHIIGGAGGSTAFSSTYPVIYRKASVWLRYAEALNRAGYPSMAFAILKNGICNNSKWFPAPESDYNDYKYKGVVYDSYKEIENVVEEDILAQYPDEEYAVQKVYIKEALSNDVDTIDSNIPDEETQAICYYIDKRELKKDAPYVNFKTPNMYSTISNIPFAFKTDLLSSENGGLGAKCTYGSDNATDQTKNITIGIHQRGCGRIKYDERNSCYNYVDKVIEFAKANGKTLTKEDIYDGNHDADVQDAVEDLIIDEMGLELTFEGTRFFDLSRVARRRNDPNYLAKRVAMRTGTLNTELQSWLQDETHWYLPLPTDEQ